MYIRNTLLKETRRSQWCIDKRDKNKMAAAGMWTVTRDPRLSEGLSVYHLDRKKPWTKFCDN